MPRGPEEGPVLTHLAAALAEIRLAEEAEGCGYCRRHITTLRVLAEDMVWVAALGEDLGRDGATDFSRRVGAFAESVGALGMLGRIVHRVKGIG